MLNMIHMEAWYSNIEQFQIGKLLLNTIMTVDAVECGVWCSQLAECKSYRTEKVHTYILHRNLQMYYRKAGEIICLVVSVCLSV